MIPQFELSPRAAKLKAALFAQAQTDRSGEWFRNDDFEKIGVTHKDKPVIIRKALAIEEMLKKMTDPEISKRTLTYTIADDELLVGVLPMGSNGLGKMFPNYLTIDEQRVGSFTNRDEYSLLGHNTVDYEVLLSKGLLAIIAEAKAKLHELDTLLTANAEIEDDEIQDKKDFYTAVIISCEAVVKYSERFADLATEQAKTAKDPKRQQELLEIARVCRKVPANKADTFHEAMQSIYTFHVALHASMNYLSLGRLDQVLIHYMDQNRLQDEAYLAECTELFECFIVKAAWRLNLTTEYLVEQDHIDHYASLGIHPYYLDQRAGVNNFLQNVIVSGLTPDGADATNVMTYVILTAFQNCNISTPGIYVRMHKNSREELRRFVAHMISRTENLPGILNDEVLVPAMYHALVGFDQVEEEVLLNTCEESKAKHLRVARDYCVDGCWEPILNGISDWTFGMLNGMNIMQCAFNRGAALDPNPGTLRGAKLSFISDEVTSYEQFQEIFRKHMQFFIDQSTFGLYVYYMLDEFVNPSPLFSAVLGTCMQKGRDKSWGGTEYNLGGTILIGVPDMVNTIAAVKKWVFDQGKYKLADVLSAMRSNFTVGLKEEIPMQKIYDEMKVDFKIHSPKFGDNTPESIAIADFILKSLYDAVMESKLLADKVFLHEVGPDDPDRIEILRLRRIAGYYGDSLERRFGSGFNMRFTVGCGTFEQYPLQGLGVVASADRNSGDPLTANFSPYPGSVDKSAAHILESFQELHLERLSAGAITDLCIDVELNNEDYIVGLLNKFINCGGNMLTLTVGNRAKYQTIYELAVATSKMEDPVTAYAELEKYRDVNVRVGGWQAPFISMSLDQMENYINRVLTQ